MRDLIEFISKKYSGKIVEIGIGRYQDVARELIKLGFNVVVTDVRRIQSDLKIIIDDVCNPRFEIYRGASLLYSIRPPYEIQRCILSLAKKIGSDVIIVPLKNEIINGGKLVNYKSARFYLFTRQFLQALSADLQTL
uniref:UPF0146 protein ENL48_00375 n=1 Tax=Geoglobus ahangari TaxID=113653 RepID=A0A7C4W2X6_9EURY